jgi:thioesterase domain-containing protein
MAKQYVQKIQTIQPEGPYLLGGYCLGGTIALEVAQQLRAQGHQVALLALMETYDWNRSGLVDKSFFNALHFYLQKLEFHVRNFLLLNGRQKLTFLSEKCKIAQVRSRIWYGSLQSKWNRNDANGTRREMASARIWKNNDRAALDYQPTVHSGPLTHFRTIKQYSIYQGAEIEAQGELRTYQLPVYPAGMLVEPFVQTLADELRQCIEKALDAQVQAPILTGETSLSAQGTPAFNWVDTVDVGAAR